MSDFVPLFDRIVVRRHAAPEITKNGLFIPDPAKERPAEGTVIDVGGKVEMVRAKDHVVFGKYAGTEINVDGDELLLLREEEIFGIRKARTKEQKKK